MCMYYYEYYITKDDIFSYMVFKKRSFGLSRKRRTIMRQHKYRPKKGRTTSRRLSILGNRVEFGIFSYSHYCPNNDPMLEVWLCKIPKGSVIYSNGWEYSSDNIEFVKKC